MSDEPVTIELSRRQADEVVDFALDRIQDLALRAGPPLAGFDPSDEEAVKALAELLGWAHLIEDLR